MFVAKFGGTSVGSPRSVGRIIEILKDKNHCGKTAVAVISAFSGVTDDLIDISRKASTGVAYREALETLAQRHRETASFYLKKEQRKTAVETITAHFNELEKILEGIAILGELSLRSLDLVMSFGERLSASLLTCIFNAHGLDAAYLDTTKLIKTNDNFGNAEYIPGVTYDNIRTFFSAKNKDWKKNTLYVATGFIASTAGGQISTLGRGGSDLTAAIFGAALGAEEVEIWTDVDGILTADPRLVKTAFRIDEISYAEAMEISHFGAKVLFTPSVKPTLEKGIPIRICDTFNPSGAGTLIVKKANDGNYPIRGISSMDNVALIRIQGSGMVGVAGFSARVFGAMAGKGINVILITQSSSEYSICFAVLPENAEPAVTALKEEFAAEIKNGSIEKPHVETNVSIIAVVGARMKSTTGVSGRFFHALGRNGINVIAIAQGSSELNISAVIPKSDVEKALNAVHEAFFLAGVRSVNLFLMGTGLIGGTLLDQIHQQKEILANKDKIRINLIGAANIFRMVVNRDGLDPKKAKALLNQEPSSAGKQEKPTADGGMTCEPFDLQKYVEKMISLNLPNACFCDCTASDDIAAVYEKILHSAISIVTPNKRANSGPFDYYNRLISYSRQRLIPYLYETTVCAGLPVISTLRDLYLSGDRVRKIEAVVSGTLSFIFSNFDGKKPFSALVREAKAKGYTEPDPRDDLNAMDAARKALILARECGLPLEFSNVVIEPILPASCFKAKDVEAFFTELEKSDAVFEKRRAEAASRNMALCYVAVIENGTAKISLRAEAAGSPFRSLVDSDNLVVITTDRYSKLPMVIKGPGAGAQVTAGGVFADIVRIARTLV